MKTELVTEGKTRLKVPDSSFYEKPEDAPVFFNPEMKVNRSITVSFLQKLNEPKFADSLCATGASGVRAGNEAEAKVFLNDLNPEAASIAKENAELNELDAETSNEEANLFLSRNQRKFDFVDVDPFGSPSRYVDNAVEANSLRGPKRKKLRNNSRTDGERHRNQASSITRSRFSGKR